MRNTGSKTGYSESWSNSAFHCGKIRRNISVSKFFRNGPNPDRTRWSVHPGHQINKILLDHPLMILLIFVMVHMIPMIYCAVKWICLQRLILTCRNLMQSNFCDDLQPSRRAIWMDSVMLVPNT